MRRALLWLGGIILTLLAASYIWRDDYPWLVTLHQGLGLPEPPAALDRLPTPSGKVVVYRWQNEQGGWHYGNQPPEGVAYERLTVDPDANLMPASSPP